MNIYQLHPKASRIVPAEKTLFGTANATAVKFCGPYSMANSMGWWVRSPVDIDITWDGKGFTHDLKESYGDYDHALVKSLIRDSDGVDIGKFCPEGGRSKFTWGAVEPSVVQIWTGCIFRTPPGWGLLIRSPINLPRQNFYVMEGILDTDWMQYDIWTNLAFDKEGTVELRKNGFPIAQLIPFKREDKWDLKKEMINRDTAEANRVFEYWIQYNQKKYGNGGKQAMDPNDLSLTKDATTYWKERKRLLSGNFPNLDEVSFNQYKKHIFPYVKPS